MIILFSSFTYAQVTYFPPRGLPVPNGTAGGIPYYISATQLGVVGAGTLGQCLLSGGTGTPTWGNCALAGSGITSLNGQTGSTQVFANETNITITSSSNTHSLGWAGTLSLARGGTGSSLTGASGGFPYFSSTSAMSVLSAGTSGQILTSGGAGTPTWNSASSMAITSLNGQTGSTQVFSNDSNLVISSSNNTHSFSMANALSLINNSVLINDVNINNSQWGAPGPGMIYDSNVGPQPWFLWGTTDTTDGTQPADIGFSAGSNNQVAGGGKAAGLSLVSGGIGSASATGGTGAVGIATGTNAGSGANGGILLRNDGGNPFTGYNDNAITMLTNTVLVQATNGLDMGSKKITSLLNPTNPQDAATKFYVDAASSGGPGGVVGQVQFNNGSGGFGASSSLFWDGTNKFLGIGDTTDTPLSPVFVVDYPTVNRATVSSNSNPSGSSPIDYIIASEGRVEDANTNTITFAAGIEGLVRNEAGGIITEARALSARSIDNNSSGSITQAYGLRVEDQTGGVSNWSIYTGLGKAHIGDDLELVGNFLLPGKAVLGGVTYTDATKLNVLAAGTSGQFLKSNGAASPTWATAVTSAITSLNSQTNSSQIFANDTNLSITSSAGTHTLGWLGTLSLARGGTNAALVASLGAISYSTATALALSPVGTSGQVLTSNGAAAPSWALAVDNTKLPLAGGTMSGAINMGGFQVNNMADPSVASDAATKSYVDNLINGLTWKAAVEEATTAALPANTYSNGASGVGATLTEVGVGALSIDGQSPAVGDRVLIKNEVAGSHNGIYVVTAAGSGIAAYVLTRSSDFDQSAEISQGDTVFVNLGAVNSTTAWSLSTATPLTVGTTAMTFVQVSGPGSIIAGTGISVSGNTVSLITPVTISSGGTNNSSLGPVAGGVIYSDATKLNTLAAGTSGQFLKSNGAGTPSWSVPTDTGITSLNSQTGVTQVFANETNIAVTSSNNTHTFGWLGTLSLARGGTSASLSAIAGGSVYSTGSAMAILAAGTSGQVLTSGGANAPTWTTPTTGTVTNVTGSGNIASSGGTTPNITFTGTLPIANGGTNNGSLGPVVGGVVYTNATQELVLAAGTSGQFLQSVGGNPPTWATALTSAITSLNSQTGATQVFANDANITVTSSSNTHTLGWASTLSVARGGTGVGSYTSGSVPYSNGTILTQDNANLFWDGTNHRMGIGNTSPGLLLEVVANQNSANGIKIDNLNGSGSSQAVVDFSFGTGSLTRSRLGYFPNTDEFRMTSGGDNLGFLTFYTGGATDVTSALERMRIDKNGNVGIGTTNPLSALYVQGAIVSNQKIVTSGAAVNLNDGNVQVLQSVGGSTITLSNMQDGASLTLIVSDTTSRTYVFDSTSCSTAYFTPANAATTNGTRSTYTIIRTTESAATKCYISWMTGLQ